MKVLNTIRNTLIKTLGYALIFPRSIYILAHSLINIYRIQNIRRHSSNQIVIISLLEHFGDIIVAIPIAEDIKSDERIRLIWMCRTPFTQVFRMTPCIDNVLTVSSLSEAWLIKRTLPHIRFLDLNLDERRCSYMKFRIKNSNSLQLTQDNYYFFGGLLHALSITGHVSSPNRTAKLSPPYSQRVANFFVNRKKPFAVVHFVSNEPDRSIPQHTSSAIVTRLLADFDIDVIEIGLFPYASVGARGATDLTGKFSIPEYAALISKAAFFIGVDSMFAHIANAFSIKSLILLGKYRNYEKYMPYCGSFCDPQNAYIHHHAASVSHLQPDEANFILINAISNSPLLLDSVFLKNIA